jgi:drug/metabolite transporter (DMT)-like permease
LISHALNFFQAHVVAFAVLAEPVITASLAVVLIHDVITPVMIAGGALVLAAMGAVLATSQSKSSMQDIEDI